MAQDSLDQMFMGSGLAMEGGLLRREASSLRNFCASPQAANLYKKKEEKKKIYLPILPTSATGMSRPEDTL